ncbi:MAG: histidine kinase [Bacteroidetes bacterium]|nr:histidine kinase [Bacteroidota bacterium]
MSQPITINYKYSLNRWLRFGYGLLLGIILNFILDVIFGLIYKQYSLFQPVSNYLGTIIITYVVFESLFWINRMLSNRYNWESKPIFRFLGQLIINSVVSLVIVYGLRLIIALFFGFNDYISFFDELIIIGYIIFIVLIYTTLDLIIFLLNRWRNSLAELERFKKENAEFKFESLRSQLNPHFLFNSLNTLSSLVYENQDKAGLFIRELSDVYRYILENRDKELIVLSKELHFANSFIELSKLRFDKNLEVEMVNEHNNDDKKIAPLTLQMLVENAIKHNVISKKQPLTIRILIYENTIEVRNNLQPKRTNEYSSELGLKNIISRYQFLTKRTVEVSQTDLEFSVKIPLI